MAFKFKLLFGAGIVAISALDTAQGAAAAPLQVEEVVVTAQRREESLQRVPIAVTALDTAALERRQIVDLAGLQRTAPNMNLTSFPSDPLSVGISIRGLTQTESLITKDPSVGVYLDGVYIARNAGGNLNLVDIQRAEVLRGPQGTLFGRNTIGGAISLTANQPSNIFGGWASLRLGNYDTLQFTSVTNLPVIQDRLALRIAYQHLTHDGYGKDALLNRRALSDMRSDFLRVSLKANPTETLEALVNVDLTASRLRPPLTKLVFASRCAPPTSLGNCLPARTGHPTDSLANYIGGDFYENSAGVDGRYRGNTWGVGGVLTWRPNDAFTVKSISAYRRLSREAVDEDNDGTPYVLNDLQFTSLNQHQFSQELQAYGKAIDKRLDWILGLYYFEESGEDNSAASNLVPLTTAVPNYTLGTAHNKSYAVYVQGTYAITHALRATAGVRYTKDTRELTSFNFAGGTGGCLIAAALRVAPTVCQATLPKLAFDYTPWTIGLDYDLTERAMVYGKVSRGFRSGGYNMRGAILTTNGFGPENVTAYEIGAKADLLERRLRVNASLYQNEYSQIQIVVNTPGANNTVLVLTENAGHARIRGGELEATGILTSRLRLEGSVGLTDAKYTSVDKGATTKLTDKFVQVPRVTYALGAEYRAPIKSATADIRVDYSWRDDIYFAQVPQAVQSAYGLLDAQIALDVDAVPGLRLAIWGRNLTEQHYFTEMLSLITPHGVVVGWPGEPRTFGLSATYHFGAER